MAGEQAARVSDPACDPRPTGGRQGGKSAAKESKDPSGRISFAKLIGTAVAINLPLSDFWNSTPWEFAAAVEGYNRHQNGGEDKPGPMTPDRFDQLVKARATAKASKGLH